MERWGVGAGNSCKGQRERSTKPTGQKKGIVGDGDGNSWVFKPRER